MKRLGNVFKEICSYENIERAHEKAKKGKSYYSEVVMVDGNREKYFNAISRLLKEKRYKNSSYKVMMKSDGNKMREIWKLPYFPDRIIHHCIVNVLEDMWIKGFVRDTYSSIPKRGIHDGVKRVRKSLLEVAGTKYCLKLDVRKFYQSIDHEILKTLLRKKIKDNDVLWLLDEIIDSAAGVPIGNYSSQYFANVYLSGLDHEIKERLKVKHYFRYCDDMVLLSSNKDELHQWKSFIEKYLNNFLKLKLKGNWQVFPVDARGIDFLGYRFFHDYTLVRKSIVQRFKQKYSNGDYKCLSAYNGWFMWANSYHLTQKFKTT